MNSGNRIDLDELKRQHDLRAVVERTIGQSVGRANLFCPFHSHNHDTPSLHVYDNGTWHCFSCGKDGDVITWVGYLLFGEGYNPTEHFKDVIDSLGALPIAPAPAVKPRREIELSLPQSLIEKFVSRMTAADYEYWEVQAIPRATLEHFQIGRTLSYDYRINDLKFPAHYWTIPHLYRGVLTGFKLRRDDRFIPNAQKYTSRGKRIAPYNIDALLSSDGVNLALINEDEKSTWAAHGFGEIGTSIPANQWRREWSTLLAHVKDIAIVANNEGDDKVGLSSAVNIRRNLGRGRILLPTGGKDLFDMRYTLHQRIGDPDLMRTIFQSWLEIERSIG